MKTKELSDFGHISALYALGYQPESVDKQGTRVVFTFEWDDNMQDIEDRYFKKGLDVDAFTHSKAMREVKGIVYAVKEGRYQWDC